MKKIIQRIFALVTVLTGLNSAVSYAREGVLFNVPQTPTSEVRKQTVQNRKADKLEKELKQEQEKVEKAETPEAKAKALEDLEKKTEEVNTWISSTQNFFGYGPKAQANRAAAQKRKDEAVKALAEEKALYDTLDDKKEQAASKARQMRLQKQINTEDIALGNKWSWKKRALITAAAAATAYVLDQKFNEGRGSAAIGGVVAPLWEKVPAVAGSRIDPRTWSMQSLNPMNYLRSSSTPSTGDIAEAVPAALPVVSVAPSTLRQGSSWLVDKAATMVVGSAVSAGTGAAYNKAINLLDEGSVEQKNKKKIVKILGQDGRAYYMDESTGDILGLIPPA